MKLGKAWDAYYAATGTASTVVRQLSLAGFGIIYIFRNAKTGRLPRFLLWPSIFILLTIAFDIAQYVSQSITWRRFALEQEDKHKKTDDQAEVDDPAKTINAPAEILFVLKVACATVAFGLLLAFLFGRLFSF
jgi:hypothetical protein